MKLRGRVANILTTACGLMILARPAICQSVVVVPSNIGFTATADSLGLPAGGGIITVGQFGGGSTPFKFAGTYGSGPNFLVLSPPSGVTPAGVYVMLNPNVVPYLSSGTYTTFLWFSTPDQSCPPCSVTTVTLNLVSQPPPAISSVVGAAALQPASVAPGQLVSIFGDHLGTPPVSSQYDAGGLYPTNLGNTTVEFKGVAAALLFVSTTQINAMVPFAVAGQNSVDVVVTHDGKKSAPFTISVADTAPGLFTRTQNGTGQGAIIDNVTGINSADNPAPKGSVISLFGTGAGLWKTTFPEGSIYVGGPDSRSALAASVSLTIGGQPATIQYAGAAPYQILGAFQVNAVVPNGIGSGPQPVVITVGQSNNAQQQVTVAVK